MLGYKYEWTWWEECSELDYVPDDHTREFGDGWDMEDLSVWSWEEEKEEDVEPVGTVVQLAESTPMVVDFIVVKNNRCFFLTQLIFIFVYLWNSGVTLEWSVSLSVTAQRGSQRQNDDGLVILQKTFILESERNHSSSLFTTRLFKISTSDRRSRCSNCDKAFIATCRYFTWLSSYVFIYLYGHRSW